MVRAAAARGARIACLPELFNTMCFCVETRPEYFDWADPVPGPTTERMAAEHAFMDTTRSPEPRGNEKYLLTTQVLTECRSSRRWRCSSRR